jgi:hypothetical protein
MLLAQFVGTNYRECHPRLPWPFCWRQRGQGLQTQHYFRLFKPRSANPDARSGIRPSSGTRRAGWFELL